ncbi:hypothetical protein B0H13DRAFT_2688107 [Mycena leptocephala]|nr:hypothetical protein B0H13DRAFT_2688107 [Mycena leptocephala]
MTRHPRPTYQASAILRHPNPPRFPLPLHPAPPLRVAPFSHPLSMAPPCLRRSVGFKLSRSPIPPCFPGLSWRTRRDESMDETTSVHGGGTKVLSRRSARGGDAFLLFRPRIQRRRVAAVGRRSTGPYLHPHPHRTRLAPRLDPSPSIPPSLTGTNATPPSATPATAHTRVRISRRASRTENGDGDEDGAGDGAGEGARCLGDASADAYILPCAYSPSLTPSSSARAGSAVAAILKHGGLRLGVVDGYAPLSVCMRVRIGYGAGERGSPSSSPSSGGDSDTEHRRAPPLHAYSTAESRCACICEYILPPRLLRAALPIGFASSTAVGPLIERGCRWLYTAVCECAPRRCGY